MSYQTDPSNIGVRLASEKRLREALQDLSDAVVAYGKLDCEDIHSAEWDALLEADRHARKVLRETRLNQL